MGLGRWLDGAIGELVSLRKTMAFLRNPKNLIIVLVITALAIGGVYLSQQGETPPADNGGEEKPAPTTGTIEGSLSFPSEGIPSELTVCAEDTSTKKKYCTKKHLQNEKYTYKVGYKIKAPAGKYLVFAYLPSGSDGYPADYRAYYNEFVTCGLSVDCASHKPIVVTVKAGKTTSDIDPQDWYD